MLEVKTPEEVLRLIEKEFRPLDRVESVPLSGALGRVLAEDIKGEEYVPDFDRSTVDGYALRAKDTFGCADAVPAILNLVGEIKMGEGAQITVPRDACVYVPTGGAIPEGCDAVVMVEEIVKNSDGSVTIHAPAAPWQHIRQIGEDICASEMILPGFTEVTPAATEETKKIRLSTTTSVNDSGLLGYLLPIFEEKYGYEVEVYSAGTGKSIANARMGNADLILVHSKKQEDAFVEDGFSCALDGMDAERLNWMYNYFVLCGPSADPAAVKDAADVKAAFKAIADGKHTFISRGDGSGTHTKELSLWPEELGITADAESFRDYTDWYISANTGMGACLVMAEELGAYILTDKATFLTFAASNGVMD